MAEKKSPSLRPVNWAGIPFFVLFSSICQPQPVTNARIQFNHFSADHGLSQTVFHAILQDRKGYMWFGSSHGLIKFDGNTFTSFDVDPSKKNALPDQDVARLCQDSSGNIWLSTRNCPLLSKYDQHTRNFTSYRYDDRNKFSGPAGIVTCLLTDRQGQLWIGTEAGLYYYEAAKDRMINFSELNSTDTLCSGNISCFMMDHNGMLWIGTSRGINIYDPIHKKIKWFNPSDKNYPANQSIACLMEDHSGEVWISIPGKGIYRYNPVTGVSKIYHHDSKDSNSNGSDAVNFLVEDSRDNIWVCAYEGGISVYQSITDNFKTYRANVDKQYSLTTDQVVTFYEDRSGVLWIGTNGGGLISCDLTTKKFNIYQNWDKEYISHWPLNLYKDRSGKIYMATFGRGVQQFNPATGNFKSYKFLASGDKIPSVNFCYGAIEASDGKFYIVGYNSGFHEVNRKSDKFTTAIPEGYYPDAGSDNIFNCIAEDLDKRLWIGTNNGLKCYDIRAKKFSGFEHLYRDTSELSKSGIVNLYCDPQGLLWIAGSNGLSVFNTKSGKIIIFKHDDSNPNSISNNTVNYLYDDNKGTIWIATDGGLNRFDKKTGLFTWFLQKDGLPANSVIGILPDEIGNLWLSTNNGICKFTPPGNKNAKAIFRNYNRSDGLPGDEFYYTTSVKANDGTLYFGTSGGLVTFKPSDIKDNLFIPPVLITNFSVFNKSVIPGDATGILKFPADETRKIKLSYRQNSFSFTFSALSYIHPEKNRYAYMLEGFDKGWIYTDASKLFANYTNLDAGTYIFKVKGSNNDGIWNENATELKIIIAPPWWQTWWFKMLCILTIAVILYIVYNNRMQKLKDIHRIRDKIASDLHDDLGATLSSISIMSELVNQQVKNEVPQASLILEKIGTSSRNMIESVNDMVWAINPQKDSFEHIITRMRNFASEILSAKEIAFHFDFDKTLLQSKLKMEMRKNFYLIFKEAVNNLAKYSKATNAFITIRPGGNNLKLSIRDDGEGFNLSSVVEGNGLRNMRQRADAMNAIFRLESVPGTGTIIELDFKNG